MLLQDSRSGSSNIVEEGRGSMTEIGRHIEATQGVIVRLQSEFTHTQQAQMDAKAASATAVALDHVPSPPPTRVCLLKPLWIGRSSAPREPLFTRSAVILSASKSN